MFITPHLAELEPRFFCFLGLLLEGGALAVVTVVALPLPLGRPLFLLIFTISDDGLLLSEALGCRSLVRNLALGLGSPSELKFKMAPAPKLRVSILCQPTKQRRGLPFQS